MNWKTLQKSLLLAAALTVWGCSEPSDHQAQVREINPVEFSGLKVESGSASLSTLEPGEYTFSMQEQPETDHTARYSIYVSDEEYMSMTTALKEDFVFTVGPGQSESLRLSNGSWLYIASTDNQSGSWQENLEGTLLVERN